MSSKPITFNRNFYPEALEVDNDHEDDDSCYEVHHVRETIAPEGFSECTTFVIPGKQEMEQGDDGTLEFGTSAGIESGRRERFPDDTFAYVGCDEEGDTGA